MRTIQILAVFCFFISTAHAQSYTSFISADSSDVWKQSQSYSPYPDWRTSTEQVFRITGDTLIGAFQYAKLHVDQVEYFTEWYNSNNDTWYYGSGLGGALREANKQVFYIPYSEQSPSTTEYMIYDFNLQVGDTVPDPITCHSIEPCWPYNESELFELVIYSIDSVLIGSEYRKRFNLGNPEAAIIEGIGCTTGLLHSKSPYFLSGYNWLSCYQEQGVPLYTGDDGLFPACLLNMSLEERPSNNSFQISPNPIRSGNALFLSAAENIRGAIEVFDLQGRLCIEKEDVEANRGIHIDLRSGMYLIKINSEEGTFSSRLLVE